MSVDSIQFTTKLQNGAKLIWDLSWDEEDGSISLKHVNFTIDPQRQVFIREDLKRNIVGTISSYSNADGSGHQLGPPPTGASFGST